AGAPPARQCRGRDERGLGARRCGGRHHLLRRGCGRRADRERGHRRPRRRHADAHRRPEQPGTAPGIPARGACRHPRPDARPGSPRLLSPRHGGRPAGRPRPHHRAPRRRRHHDAPRAAAARRGRAPDRRAPAYPCLGREPYRGGNRGDRGNADGARARGPDSPRGTRLKMQYLSTRGGMPPAGFTEILLGGLAPDGGLVVPQHYPRIDLATLAGWRELDYPALAYEILSRYVGDIEPAILRELIARTYTPEVVGTTAITPVERLEPGLCLLRLSNGPTLAFKDLAMQLLGNLFEYQLAREGRQLNILGATSGDTGSAAEYA